VTRGGRKTERDEPERRCIATGESQPKGGLIRFVVGPDDRIVPDVAARLPGRGIWVSADRGALQRAVQKNLFARGAKRAVGVPEDLVDQVEALVARRLVDLVALARKSGDAVAGFEKVREATAGHVAVLLQACDGSDAQKGKIRPPADKKAHISCLSGHELGLAFGRENVIHAALAAGGLAERVVEEGARLAALRGNRCPGGADGSGDAPDQEGDGTDER
jgi:predicted RNA-binding protein YlxR (DUF448 family)